MSVDTNSRKGRRLDATPNKVFGSKLVETHEEDNTGTYETVYNDENGKRQVKTERLPLKKRGPSSGGRSLDMTPGRVFTAIRKGDNPDGTVTYVIPYNDENGIRMEREEIRTKGQRGGHRQPDATPSKVISGIKSERIANDAGDGASEDIVMSVPYNDKNGQRLEGYVILSVNAKGNLSSKVTDNKPSVFVRQRHTDENSDEDSNSDSNSDSNLEPVVSEVEPVNDVV